MSSDAKSKTLGQAIDEIIGALRGLETSSRAVAIRAACEQLGVEPPVISSFAGRPTAPLVSPGTAPDQTSAPHVPSRVPDIRAFKAEKQPVSAVEMAAVVAHYLQGLAPEGEQKNTVTAADLNKYFRQADFPLPKRLEQLLPDAKAAGYFDSAARGAYRLNPVGYNLVVHTLPRQAASSSARRPRVPVAKRQRGRKRSRRA